MIKRYLLSLTVMVMLCWSLEAQTPEAFKYQAVVRDNAGNVLANKNIGMKVNLIPKTPTEQAVYSETFTPTTNEFGLINLEIGNGTAVIGTFSTVDWSSGVYFVEVLMDKAGGTSYISMGMSQLLSVPYALYAKSAGNGFSGDYNDLRNTPDLTSYPTSVDDADADPTNEKIESIQLNGTKLEITEGGKKFSIDLGPLVDGAYQSGFNAGKIEGYNSGLTADYHAGYNAGYNNGRKDGFTSGYNGGYNNGFADGYDVGYDDGFYDGSF